MCIAFSVSVTDDYPFFAQKGLEDIRDGIQRSIIDVIHESFVYTADQDYISARLMALYGNDRAFYWSAAQCLEKYLKAILLYRGVAIKDLSHNIEKLFEKVKIEVKEFANFQFDIDLSNSVDEHIVDVMELYNIKDFISLITLLGSPHQRYNQSGYNFNSSLVFHLDSLVYFTRSLLTEWPIEGSFTKSIQPNLLNVLYIQNDFFKCSKGCSEFAHMVSEFRHFSNLTSTSLDRLSSQTEKDRNYRFALNWLNKRMVLPHSIKSKLKNK
ncbi:TPA: HEPN domain-containing protein [Vibrio parahaemolyticus]|nr:HEPN domain-containing protein [Vibrio parahaemolyticus]EGQ9942792.1 HEPN domain-containing protein [Vibrio parahaemolyticus]EJG0972471.1 HEPN domain-containing protein [Vibrio parahaemolyticus]EJL7423877.1 HEPN domain-containing protein [Vibrio parahaemolyticus]ELA7071135.1 HEPN domain-containing protein [Vibrio parahaemolyticus]